MLRIYCHTIGVPHPRAWRRNGQGFIHCVFLVSVAAGRVPASARGPIWVGSPATNGVYYVPSPQDASLLFPLAATWMGLGLVAQRDASQLVSG